MTFHATERRRPGPAVALSAFAPWPVRQSPTALVAPGPMDCGLGLRFRSYPGGELRDWIACS